MFNTEREKASLGASITSSTLLSQMDLLQRFSTERLPKAIDQLEAKLEPILMLEASEPDKLHPEAGNSRCSLATGLQTQNESLLGNLRRLERLLALIDL